MILCSYFVLFYSIVMRREENELQSRYGAVFGEYARAVPLFLPRVTAAKLSGGGKATFSFVQYKKNREYQAAIGFLLMIGLLLLIWHLRFLSSVLSCHLRASDDASNFQPASLP